MAPAVVVPDDNAHRVSTWLSIFRQSDIVRHLDGTRLIELLVEIDDVVERQAS